MLAGEEVSGGLINVVEIINDNYRLLAVFGVKGRLLKDLRGQKMSADVSIDQLLLLKFRKGEIILLETERIRYVVAELVEVIKGNWMSFEVSEVKLRH